MLNLQFYKGKDLYSDGDIEDEILAIVKQNKDFALILSKDDRWPILYHLAPDRENLLEWYPFNKDSSLLEIGAGCGALTGLFCEKVNSVTAVELSKKRAEIIEARHENEKNLNIFAGNLMDIVFEEKFDYITLIGVLEYAKKFIDTQTPFADLITKVKQLLKPNGILIVAIENKFGLKYWAGAREDHTGELFGGLESRAWQDIRTFGKDELKRLLDTGGDVHMEFYYPLPDYKIPTHIFSDRKLPAVGEIGDTPNYDQERYRVFSETLVWGSIIKNNMFDIFANSFLIFCHGGR